MILYENEVTTAWPVSGGKERMRREGKGRGLFGGL